ncbi:MAG TPA: mycothiol synthase, partial [Ilumatobacteraceae bacterium]|nr:mycothiol synthase [Ilumatobacteraceae bacterium]
GAPPLTSVAMLRIETLRTLSGADSKAITVMLDAAEAHDGFPPLSDHLLLELERPGPDFVALKAVDDANETFAGYAQLAKTNDSTAIEIVIPPGGRDDFESVTTQLLRTALDVVASEGGGTVYWWVHHPDERVDAVARQVGLRLGRRLLQMRRPLPITETTSVDTRAFVVGRDEAEWVRVNNAAFHDHPEQGGWTVATLEQREAEPWFDPAGFLLHERDGKLAAFCWTKVHADVEPPMGEIYVIAVDPEFHGLGLGKALTVAGLENIAARGLTVGMLHVDAANTAAMGLYTSLGFTVHHEDHAYVADNTRSAHP